jgi:hypothetical protein
MASLEQQGTVLVLAVVISVPLLYRKEKGKQCGLTVNRAGKGLGLDEGIADVTYPLAPLFFTVTSNDLRGPRGSAPGVSTSSDPQPPSDLTMRISVLVLPFSCVPAAWGFSTLEIFRSSTASIAQGQRRRLTKVGARPDSSDAIQEALRISEEYGVTSVEARVAWEAVEEMDASDLSPAFVSSAANSAFASDADAREFDYAYQVYALDHLLQSTNEKLEQIKQLVSSIQYLELGDPTLAKWGTEGDAANQDLKEAIRESKAAADLYGPNSPQAIEAWRRVEECAADEDECSVDTRYRYSAAAIRAHHLYDAVIDSALLQDAMNGIGTLESLRRSIQIESQRLQRRLSS